ncbi:MAG: RNase H family protein [Pseudomonadota bacterium]|nr:RNase H family protein [Pseudomonadota bacterium]
MNWIEADFKGTKVWAEVDDAGRPVAADGRRGIRYSDAPGAKVYRAAASAVKDLGGAPRGLDAGTPAAPSTGATTGASSGASNGASRGAAGTSAPGAPARTNGRGSGFGKAGTRTAAQSAAAATDAQGRIAALPTGTVMAFTDGACTGNPGPAGSGAVVKLPDGRVFERFAALGIGTNNIGELTAIQLAVDLLTENAVDPSTPVALYTDSQYALGVLTKGWKAKANVELIASLKAALRPWKRLKIEWVAGHVGVPENERADALARKGVDESKRR